MGDALKLTTSLEIPCDRSNSRFKKKKGANQKHSGVVRIIISDIYNAIIEFITCLLLSGISFSVHKRHKLTSQLLLLQIYGGNPQTLRYTTLIEESFFFGK